MDTKKSTAQRKINPAQKNQKTFQKPIDKQGIIWYNKVYSVKGNHNNITYLKGEKKNEIHKKRNQKH